MKAETIDELILQLEEVINTSIKTKSRLGYFAALYHKVTCRVRAGILKNEFEDNKRMELLDVLFGNRYLEALEAFMNNQKMTASWEVAFKAGTKSRYLVLHHLLLAINAHINLDLGISSVQAASSDHLSGIQKDFNTINAILAELTYELMNKINRVSPLLSVLGLHATNNNSVFIQFAISNARDGAWVFAQELYQKKENDFDSYILERDQKIRKLGEGIISASPFLKISIWIIRLFEWRNPARIIKVLRTQEKPYFTVTESAIQIRSKPKPGTEPKEGNGKAADATI